MTLNCYKVKFYRNFALFCDFGRQQWLNGSKTTDGKVGIGCYVKIDTKRVSETAIRLTDNVSVYTGEMAAVHHALSEVGMLDIDQREKVAIFTDSLSTVRTQ